VGQALVEKYGDPCRGCGMDLGLDIPAMRAVLAGVPELMQSAIGDTDGLQHLPELGWTAKAYALHVADNLRLWAERVYALATGPDQTFGRYDENALAVARVYDTVPLTGVWWSLSASVRDWTIAMDAGEAAGVTIEHPALGHLAMIDIVQANVHDARHHAWDIERSIGC